MNHTLQIYYLNITRVLIHYSTYFDQLLSHNITTLIHFTINELTIILHDVIIIFVLIIITLNAVVAELAYALD